MTQGGTVKDAIEAFKRGELQPISSPHSPGMERRRGMGSSGLRGGMGRGMGGRRRMFNAEMGGSPYIMSSAAGNLFYISASNLTLEFHKEGNFKKSLNSFIFL
jgi:hypothetical protein